MTPVWAQRQEALLRDCVVSPDVFSPMVDRLRDFVRPYQYALETEAGKRNVYLYLAGLLSHLPRKNAEDIATLVDVERQVLQDFIGTALWDHRPLVQVLVTTWRVMAYEEERGIEDKNLAYSEAARFVLSSDRLRLPVARVSRNSSNARRAIIPRFALSPVWTSSRSI